MTPVRRSIRNLPDNPQKSSNLCLIFPIENKQQQQQQPMSVGKKEKAKPEETNEEKEIDKKTSESEVLAQVEAKTAEDEFAKSLRRSTRKTPSKYKSSNFFQDEKVILFKLTRCTSTRVNYSELCDNRPLFLFFYLLIFCNHSICFDFDIIFIILTLFLISCHFCHLRFFLPIDLLNYPARMQSLSIPEWSFFLFTETWAYSMQPLR